MDLSTYYTVIPSIVVISALIGYAVKQIPAIKDNYIPIIVCVVGAILAVLGHYFIPNFISENILDVIATGIVSGLASTGAHQIVKQIKKDE